ncbi:hypothetical protein [Streptomyces sp. NPDC017940]|uniref:hypothetical protein n=1 Tax=Streptomyces sp. NPDC017940 TaxID=3365017 RepID=UPI0037B67ADE
MRPARFQEFTLDVLPKAPEIQTVNVWDGRAFGLHLTFNTGSQLWIGSTAQAAPGEQGDQAETPVHGDTPAEVPYPDLYEGGKITPARAEDYLAAALTNSHNDEIASVYPYGSEAKNPGLGVRFHSGARIFMLFEIAGRPGQSADGQKYSLPPTF